MSTVHFLSFVSILLLTAPALGADGQSELPSVEDTSTVPQVFRVSEERRQACPRSGSVCLFGNGGGTVAGVDVNPTVGIVTTLARGTEVAAVGQTDWIPDADVWNVEIIARLRARTTPEPVTVAVMDYADPEGMARKEATAVWRIDGARVRDLGMHAVLSADDGFQPRHTYLVRVVQGAGAQEKILAEGSFLLE